MFGEDTDIRKERFKGTLHQPLPTLKPGRDASHDHELFTDILKDHVHGGLVDYEQLRTDRRLDRYLRTLSETNPARFLSEHARLSFWINMYNAWTLKVLCERYPVKSIRDLHWGGFLIGTLLRKTIWDKPLVLLETKKLSLNVVEHDIIRPQFNDPRAHFALVCGSLGCPPLRPEAFEGDTLAEQLNDQARIFLRDRTKNHFDPVNKVAHLSRIFKWYSGDFGKNETSLLFFIARFLPDNIANAIRKDPAVWSIRYTQYDWSLNSPRNRDHRDFTFMKPNISEEHS